MENERRTVKYRWAQTCDFDDRHESEPGISYAAVLLTFDIDVSKETPADDQEGVETLPRRGVYSNQVHWNDVVLGNHKRRVQSVFLQVILPGNTRARKKTKRAAKNLESAEKSFGSGKTNAVLNWALEYFRFIWQETINTFENYF